MPHALHLPHLTAAFSRGRLLVAGVAMEFEVQVIGALVVSSGAVVAADPLVVPDQKPFAQAVPNGRFPVEVAIARFDNRDERIAYARIAFAPAPAVTWRLAVTGQHQENRRRADGSHGYGVDSGHGCFMDPTAGALLTQRMRANDQYFNQILDVMNATYRHTRAWADVRPSPEHDENVICFSAGFGDGTYPSYFGYDAEDTVSMLVTDFGVVGGNDGRVAPSERKPWWQVW